MGHRENTLGGRYREGTIWASFCCRSRQTRYRVARSGSEWMSYG
jgi:hypothetical protein